MVEIYKEVASGVGKILKTIDEGDAGRVGKTAWDGVKVSVILFRDFRQFVAKEVVTAREAAELLEVHGRV